MTPNQTIDGVPHELLERCARELSIGIGPAPKNRAQELRALLDAERCSSCDDSGDLTDLTGEWRGYCICPIGVALKNRPAAQPQGEPVSTPQIPYKMLPLEEDGWWQCVNAFEALGPLYAEQTAPVAVTYQQVLTAYEYAESHPHKYLRGTTNWCAAVAYSINSK